MSALSSVSQYYGWIVLFVLSFLYLLENFDRYLISVSVIPYIDYSSYEYSLLVGPVFTIIYAFGGLVFTLSHSDTGNGALRKVSSGQFIVLFLSTLVFSVAFGLTALCKNFWQQVLVRLCMGLAQSVITPFSASIIRGLFPPDQCGTAFSIFNTGVYLAFSMSLSLGEWMYDDYGWKIGYISFGIIGAAFSFVIPLVSWWSFHSQAFPDATTTHDSYNPLVSGSASAVSEPHRVTVVSIRGVSDEQKANDKRAFDDELDISSSSDMALMQPVGDGGSGSSSSVDSFETVGIQSTGDRKDIAFRESQGSIPESGSRWCSMCSWANVRNTVKLVKRKLYRIVVLHWWENPSIFFLCFAMGLRLGAGYIWSSYTGPFFSDLFVDQENSIHCSFSYNSATGATNTAGMCSSSDYPYCVSGTCSALAKYPWHDKGMDPIDIATYMSWVPLVGSGLGNLLGGVVSDKVIRGEWLGWVASPSKGSISSKDSFSSVGSQQRNLAKERYPWRAMISGVSTLLSLPIVCISFYLEFPGCFLIYIATGLVGEMYLSQTLALITESVFISADLITSAVALFVLITTAIAGNCTLLVPLFETYVTQEKATITFQAASSDPNAVGNVWVSVTQTSALQLQQALVYSMILCYGLSGVLFICAYVAMIRKLAR